MNFEVKATIKFNEDNKIIFDSGFNFTDNKADVLISPIKNGLEVIFKFENVSNKDEAMFMAERKLYIVTNRLSWLEEISIKESKITESSLIETSNNITNVVIIDSVNIGENISIEKRILSSRIQKLAAELGTSYSPEAEEILIMWRDAVSERSPIVKIFLLFRLLEWVLAGKDSKKARSIVDRWIKDKYPTSELRKDINNKDVTIYTFLRDNVHAKSINFPFEEFRTNLPQLQNIAQTVIRGKFKI